MSQRQLLFRLREEQKNKQVQSKYKITLTTSSIFTFLLIVQQEETIKNRIKWLYNVPQLNSQKRDILAGNDMEDALLSSFNWLTPVIQLFGESRCLDLQKKTSNHLEGFNFPTTLCTSLSLFIAIKVKKVPVVEFLSIKELSS